VVFSKLTRAALAPACVPERRPGKAQNDHHQARTSAGRAAAALSDGFDRPLLLTLAMLGTSASMLAQGAGVPLTLQGLNQSTLGDVRGRGMGGAVLAATRSANAVFTNPALLTRIERLEVRIAGTGVATSQRQSQEWTPNRLYAGFSILMEDKWEGIKEPLVRQILPNPITFLAETTWVPPASPYERLQKPYDDIGPNWSRAFTKGSPLTFAAAMPFEFMELTFVAGIGGGEAYDLTHYFQNNNVLDPMIGSFRPSPIPMVATGDTEYVRWYQHTSKRLGSVSTVNPALALKYGSLSVGVTANILFGSSDDYEFRLDRGVLNFINNAFKVDPVRYAVTHLGTSDYSGTSATLGVLWENPRYAVGLTAALPLTITRSFDRTVTIDTALVVTSRRETGEESLKLPLRVGGGVILTPTDRWTVSFDYAMTGFATSEQTAADGTTTSSWVGSENYRMGVEYLAWDFLSVRAGYRQDTQPFSVVGSAIINEPVKSSVATFGLGTEFMGVLIDAAYEYTSLKYQDMWQSNVNYNLTEHHRFMVEVGYRF
jgi:opacity protein-like surface antigen